jgi:hypothetical protein
MRVLYLVFLSFLTLSCSIFDNDNPDVAFINVDSPVMNTNVVKEGLPTHSIKHAWATINNNLIGVFPIPGKVPAILNGNNTNLQINWGVNDSGDKESSIEYPFFEPIKLDVSLTPNQNYILPSKVTYVKNAVFDVVESFESNSQAFTKDLDENVNSKLVLTTKDKLSGDKSGLIALDEKNNVVEFTTFNYFSAANNKKGALWLEFDYKSEEDLFIGYDISTANAFITEYKIGLRPTPTWKRAYIDLTKELSDSRVKEYRVAFKAAYTGAKGKAVTEIYLDNIKLIHF